MAGDRIPLVDLGWQTAVIKDEVAAAWNDLIDRGAFVLGAAVESFESAYAAHTEAAHCVGVANGTDAIELLVRAAGLGAGDEVIIPANTFIATAVGIARAGAVPVPVDVCDNTLLLDPSAVAAAVGPRTAAVMPVHLYGQLAPTAYDGLLVIEDAAQCQGARRSGAPVATGTFGAATSFYPGKNLGAWGDAGAVVTNDESVAAKVRALRTYGSTVRYEHPEFGVNSRLDALQAIVLEAKLAYLDEWNALRQQAAAFYLDALSDVEGVTLPVIDEGNDHVWHLFVVRVNERDRVLRELNEQGIEAFIHYPTPVHLHGAFESLGLSRGAFPVAEGAADTILSLPIYPGITESQQTRVIEALRKAM